MTEYLLKKNRSDMSGPIDVGNEDDQRLGGE